MENTKFYLTYEEAFHVGRLIQKEQMMQRRKTRNKEKAKELVNNILIFLGVVAFMLFVSSIEGLTNLIIK